VIVLLHVRALFGVKVMTGDRFFDHRWSFCLVKFNRKKRSPVIVLPCATFTRETITGDRFALWLWVARELMIVLPREAKVDDRFASRSKNWWSFCLEKSKLMIVLPRRARVDDRFTSRRTVNNHFASRARVDDRFASRSNSWWLLCLVRYVSLVH